jgi:hypothetical protein
MVICEPTVRPMAFLWHPAIKAFVSPFTSEGGRLKFKSKVRTYLCVLTSERYGSTTALTLSLSFLNLTVTPIVICLTHAARLKTRWHCTLVAIIACVRKMVVILNSMLRNGVMWDGNTGENKLLTP